MAESSLFWQTNGTGDGTGTGYTAAQIFEWLRAFFAPDATNLGGVAPDYQNKLEVTGTATPVSVATGAALVYGIPYINTGAVTVAIPTPASSTRIDRIVLRANWTAQTVRITRVAGTEGAGAPALTQSAGTTWDIPLAQVSITTSGTITVTDDRDWLSVVGNYSLTSNKYAFASVDSAAIGGFAVTTGHILAGAVTSIKLADDAVTAAKIADGAVVRNHIAEFAVGADQIDAGAVGTSELANASVSEAKIAAGAVTEAKIGNNAVTQVKLGAAAVSTTQLANLAVTEAKLNDAAVTVNKLGAGAVTGPKLADGAVTDEKASTRIPKMSYRQGANAVNWAIPGLSGMLPTQVKIEVGAISISMVATADTYTDVNFPSAFAYSPIVVATGATYTTGVPMCIIVTDVTLGGFRARVMTADETTISTSFTVNWIAIGPSA